MEALINSESLWSISLRGTIPHAMLYCPTNWCVVELRRDDDLVGNVAGKTMDPLAAGEAVV